MARLLTYDDAVSRFTGLQVNGLSIEAAIQEAVERIFEMGRHPGTTVEIELADSDFVFDEDLDEYFVYFDEDLYAGALGFRNQSRGWSIVDQVALYKDGVNMGDREFIDMGTTNSAVTGSGYATVTIDPAGEDNSITYTANNAGSIGEEITIEYAAPAVQATTDVEVVGNAITITPGTKARMLLTAASDPSVDGAELFHDGAGIGVSSTYTQIWSDGNLGNVLEAPTGTGIRLCIDAPTVCLLEYYVAGVVDSSWADFSAALWPDLCTMNIYQGNATDVVSIAAATSSAQQVLDAVDSDDSAMALVTADASGVVTGAVAAVAATPLALPVTYGGRRKYRCPVGWSVDGGPYYVLLKKEPPVLESGDVVPVQGVGALKAAIQAVFYEFSGDQERAERKWAEFDGLMKLSERQAEGTKRWTLGMDSSLKRHPRQFM